MEITPLLSSMQSNQSSNATASKDSSGFLAILRDAVEGRNEATPQTISQPNIQSNSVANSAAATPAVSALPISGLAASNLAASNIGEASANDPLRQAFQDFVGQTFFAELIKSYRSTQKQSAYFNGGQAEKIFQGQLDQVFSEQMSKRSADRIADPMFERFMARRSS